MTQIEFRESILPNTRSKQQRILSWHANTAIELQSNKQPNNQTVETVKQLCDFVATQTAKAMCNMHVVSNYQ